MPEVEPVIGTCEVVVLRRHGVELGPAGRHRHKAVGQCGLILKYDGYLLGAFSPSTWLLVSNSLEGYWLHAEPAFRSLTETGGGSAAN